MQPPNTGITLDLIEESERSCGVCQNYSNGFCRLYLEPVEYADTCQRWH